MLLLSALGRVRHHPYLFIPSYIFSFLFLAGMLIVFPVHWHEKQQWIFIAILSIILRVVWLCLSYLVRRRLKLAESGAEDFYERYYRTADEK